MKRLLAGSAAALLLALPLSTALANDTAQPAQIAHERQGPDFASCEKLDGRDFGQCVAAIAQAFRDDRAAQDSGADAGGDAAEQALRDACAKLEGRAYGQCVSALASAQGDVGGTADTDEAKDAKDAKDAAESTEQLDEQQGGQGGQGANPGTAQGLRGYEGQPGNQGGR